MIKQAMSAAGLELLAVGGLLLFVAVFMGICFWASTRSRKQVTTWSSLPLADGTEPVELRRGASLLVTTTDPTVATQHDGGGCGKCVDCSCKTNDRAVVTGLTMN